MKTLVNIGTVVFLLFLLSTSAQALVRREYIQWTKGEFDIPADIKNLTKGSELRAFLDNKHEFTRMAAVRRLGEIEGANSIVLLQKIFANEPPPKGLDGVPLVKFEVIRTLGRINTDQAKDALLKILNDYWQKGPNVKDKKYFKLDRDFASVMPLLLKTLYKWSQDKVVFQAVEKIALSEDVKKFYTFRNGIGQKAWEIYLKGKMIRDGLNKDEESVIYILEFMEGLRERLSYDSIEYVENQAAFAVLQKHNKAVLSSLSEKLEKDLRKEGIPAMDNERNIKLRRMIGCISAALKEKVRRDKLSQKKASPTSK